MVLKKVKTEITYKVPAWNYCNHIKKLSSGTPSKETCRFCVKSGKSHFCALYNDPLLSEGQALILKSKACIRATQGYGSVVEDIDEPNMPTVDPKLLMKTTISEYMKTYKKLINDGYPEAIAEKVAKEHLLS